MIVILDAYNILKRNDSNGEISYARRQQFIQQLVRYNKIKKNQLYVIFDGGQSKWSDTSRIDGVTIVYSGYQYDADSYIKMMLDQYHAQEVLLVSSDRELNAYAYEREVPSIDSEHFYALMTRSPEPTATKATRTGIVCTAESSSEEVDQIMREASGTVPRKVEDDSIDESNRKSKKTISKQEKKLVRILEKL